MGLIVKPVCCALVDFICDRCHQGRMRPTGHGTGTEPVVHEHACSECGAVMLMTAVYPYFSHDERA